MDPLREQALAPLTRGDAERLLPTLPTGRLSLEKKVLRGRCLRYLESFDIAYGELSAVLPQVKDPRLAARVAVELVQLTYYLARRDEAVKFAKIAERGAAADPLTLAELKLGLAIVATAGNDITGALQHARFASDALEGAPRGRSRDVVAMRVQRTLAHILTHAADHADALAAADEAAKLAARVGDPWEIAWATYARGFVLWAAGRNDASVAELTRAEGMLRTHGTSLWRHTLFCLGRARMERGELADGERLVRMSAAGGPEEHAHLALLRGEAEVAERMLERLAKGPPEEELFRDAVRAIVRCHRGDIKRGVRALEDAAKELESLAMTYWALGAATHAAFWRERSVRGAGGSRAVALVRDIAARGGEGFAWYLPEVAAWLGRAAEHDARVRDPARALRTRAGGALRRAKADASTPIAASALDEATYGLRTRGLTWREVGILREMEQLAREGERLDRAALAKRLAITPNTLRVHLTRIRAKLDVGDRRGDEVVLEAALRGAPVS